MTDPAYTLELYSSAKDGKKKIADITDIAADWRRSIRLQGGYWLGTFSLDAPLPDMQQMFYECQGAHLVERYGTEATWEGMIYEMDFDDDPSDPALDVTACGYVFTANWRLVTVGDGELGNASDWIADIITNDLDPIFIVPGRIEVNELQVYRDDAELKQYAWDQILKVAQLGDPDIMPWRVWVGNDHQMNYQPIPTTPQYQVIGGLRRRFSYDWMYNDIQGVRTTRNGTQYTITQASDTRSIGRYGQRTYFLALDCVSQDAAEARRDMILRESAYPRGRAIGSVGNVEVLSFSGESLRFAPFLLQPGVYRDAQYPERIGGAPATNEWLPDESYFLVDEVEVSGDGEISLKTAYITEAELIEAQHDYKQEYKRKRRAKRRR